MNILNFVIGLGLTFMGIYTFTLSNWDWIYIVIALSQLLVGIYLIWASFKRPDETNIPLPIPF